ncbi:MAG: hypothetical protein WCC38_14610 [Pseudonocardiaceae bacterium]
MDIESVADELYSLPRAKFTAARDAAAQRAREQGHRELAEQIGVLRRPSTAAWLANQLAREHPDQIRALMKLGDALREAQRELQGEQLRRLSQQRHELVQAAVQQIRAAGRPMSDAVTRELVNTFTAAVNSSAAAQAVASGRLTAALNPADAAAELFAGAATGVADTPPPETDDSSDEPSHRELARLRTAAADTSAARDEAQRALTDADRAVDDAVTALRELRARVVVAEQTEHQARRRAQSLQRDFEDADRAARETQQRVHDLEGELARHKSR